MDEKETFAERTLRKIRERERSPGSQKKRRLSKAFLIVDAIIIILILLFFFDRGGQEARYYSSKIDYKKTEIRFSISRDNETGEYLFSLSFKSNASSETELRFNRYLASVSVTYNDILVIDKKIGPGIKKIRLIQGETKSFIERFDSSKFDIFISENRGMFKFKRKSLIQVKKAEVKFYAKITINFEEELSSTLSFKHEVDQ